MEGIAENLKHFIASPSKELSILILAGWASGISLYLSVALLGISSQAGWIHLPGELAILSNPLIIAAACLFFIVEFVADKVPYVDSIWDSVHTVIRPLGGLMLGYFAGSEHGPVIQTAYAMFAGTLTLNMHTAKAAGRLAINTSPEPFSNIGASLVEQSAVVLMFWFFIKHPVLATLLVLGILVLAFVLIKLLWKFVKKLFTKREPNPVSDEACKI